MCNFCLSPENSNPLNNFDKFLICIDCGSGAHTYCLTQSHSAQYSSNLIERIQKYNLKWECDACKKCSVCLKASDDVILCDNCDRSYHKECCVPKLNAVPNSFFMCHICKEINLKEQNIYFN